MKTVLFATTALVATASIAAADVSLSGNAKMGIVGGDAYSDETQFYTDVDVTFSMSGETDNGLSFTASVDLDESDGSNTSTPATVAAGPDGVVGTPDDVVTTVTSNGASNAFTGLKQGGETIAISAGGATLTMGDTDGAFDAAMGEVGIGGSIDDSHTAHIGFSGNSGFDGTYDGQIARFSYAFDGFTGHLSVEMDDSGNSDPVWGLGVTYNAELAGLNLAVGLGYQTADDNGSVVLFDGNDDNGAAVTVGSGDFDSVIGLSVATTFDNGIEARLNFSKYSGSDTVGDTTHSAIGLGYAMNALTIGFNYGKWDGDFGDVSGYGLAVDYDLGGGAEVQFGYGVSQYNVNGADISDQDRFSLGVNMSF